MAEMAMIAGFVICIVAALLIAIRSGSNKPGA